MAGTNINEQLSSLSSRLEAEDATLAAKANKAGAQQFSEADIVRLGRPVLPVANNQVLMQPGESDVWQQRLTDGKEYLNWVISSVGRIEVADHPLYSWAGTGWFIENNIIATTRDVVELFTTITAGGRQFRMGVNGRPMRAAIDMRSGENENPVQFEITSVLYVEPEPGPNIAFLQVNSNDPLPQPLMLDTSAVADKTNVVLVGYASRDSRIPDMEAADSIFGDVYNGKRLAPGIITNVLDGRLVHDCSALGGWAGGALVNLQTGKIIGLQAGWRFLEYNYAIPGNVIAEKLNQARNASTYERAIERQPSNVQFDLFQEGLSKAHLNAALIGGEKNTLSTGWFLTDQLLVMPNWPDTKHNSVLECRFLGARSQVQTLKGRVVYLAPGPNEPSEIGVVLIRLEKPVPGRGVKLSLRSMQDIDNIYMLHFPGGQFPLKLSISRLTKKTGPVLEYLIDSTGGSGGGPLFSVDGSVVGMHFASREGVQKGLSIRFIIDSLKNAARWSEIAKAHNLAGPKTEIVLKKSAGAAEASAKANEKILMKYALRWNIAPSKLTAAQKKLLKDHVVDPANRSKWIMDETERIRLIEKMGTLRKLRGTRGKERISDPGQKVIDSILKGPPYKIGKIEDEALSYWLPAVAWFANVIPKLPSQEAISTELHKRKLRQRMQRSAGPDFRGRVKERAKLKDWYSNHNMGALIISGIGGIGKSALISKFALDLEKETLVLWLDFDRADLAPDNALSVLKILGEQLAVQVKDYAAPQGTLTEWQELAKYIGLTIKANTTEERPALIVLDGFEVAQHSKKYNEIWPLLEILLQQAPYVRVIVSGRAAVKDRELNELNGKPAEPLPLEGLEEAAARQWLKKHKIRSEAIIRQTYELSKGSPLILKLATRFMDEGGKLDQLPKKLPQVMVEGFLYQRIYNRVINHKIRKTVKDILVLRVISPNIIEEVLFDNLPEKMSPEEVYAEILQELALVGEAQFNSVENSQQDSPGVMVNVRPEVRAASLKLLELQDQKRVNTIDARIIKYYKKRRKPTDSEKIELIYHYLRTNNVREAEKLWRQDYVKSLEGNVEDIPEKYEEARQWLHSKLGNMVHKLPVEDWEYDALGRIRDFVRRGHFSAIEGVLNERLERGSDSPLIMYDAWSIAHKNPGEAIQLLTLPYKKVNIRADRYLQMQIVAANIAYQTGDLAKATEILTVLRRTITTVKIPSASFVDCVAAAGQIAIAARNALHSEIEMLLISKQKFIEARLGTVLPLADLITPQAQSMLEGVVPARSKILKLPLTASRKTFITELFSVRNTEAMHDPPWRVKLGEKFFSIDTIRNRIGEYLYMSSSGRRERGNYKPFDVAADITIFAWERWHAALLSSSWFKDVVNLSDSTRAEDAEVALAVGAALASFRGTRLEAPKTGKFPGFLSIDRYVDFMLRRSSIRSSPPMAISKEALSLAQQYMDVLPARNKLPPFLLKKLKTLFNETISAYELSEIEDPATRSVFYIILTPNPIEAFSKSVLGVSFNIP